MFTSLIAVDLCVLSTLLTSAVDGVSTPCNPDPCQNYGICVPRGSSLQIPWLSDYIPVTKSKLNYECICMGGWTGVNCTEDTNDCTNNPCLNGGTCVDQPNMRYVCHCHSGYVGRNCEYTDPCDMEPCENGGVCTADVLGQFTCRCSMWYSGERCEVEIDPCHPQSPCLGPGSTCLPVRSPVGDPISKSPPLVVDFNCTCGPGYTGRYCDTKLDMCSGNPCLNGATCMDQGTYFKCICPEGFYGTRCESKRSLITSKPHTYPTTSVRPAGYGEPRDFLHPCVNLSCNGAQPNDGTCHAACFFQNCSSAEEINDCSDWSECLSKVKTQSHVINGTCVERFHNGHCDLECNSLACHFDGLDCVKDNSPPVEQTCAELYADGICQMECFKAASGFDGGDCADQAIKALNLTRTEPRLFMAILNTKMEHFLKIQQKIMSNLSVLLRSVVRIAADKRTGMELMADLIRTSGLKAVIEIYTYRLDDQTECTSSNQSCASLPPNLPDADLSQYVRAALATPAFRMPVALRLFAPVTDPSQLNFLPGQDLQWSRILGFKGTVGLYACLCVLAGITILLVILLVLQREARLKPSKRVFTKGIWFPPIPPADPDGNHEFDQIYPPSAYLNGELCNPSKQLLQQPLLCGTFKGNASQQMPKIGTNPLEALTSQIERVPKIVSYHANTLPIPKIERRNLKRSFGCACDVPYQENAHDGEVVAGKQFCWDAFLDPGHERVGKVHKDESCRTSFVSERGVEDHSSQPTGVQSFNTISEYRSDYQYPNCQQDSDAEFHRSYPESDVLKRRLCSFFRSQDGIHPLSSEAVNSVGHIIDQQTLNPNPLNNDPQTDTDRIFRSQNLEGVRCCQALETQSGQPEMADDQTLLHWAGRMNCGQDLVFSLPHSLCTEGKSNCATMLDKDGRTALVTAAAAGALDTIGALYQLERGAVANNRSATAARTPKTRRRHRIFETRQSTPLIAAVQSGNQEVFEYLLDEGYQLGGIDEYGRNVVHWAAATNSVQILQRLAQCKGFYRLINAHDDQDRTPLTLATREGCAEAVKFLLENRANVVSLDNPDCDPLRIAQEKGFNTIRKMLLPYYEAENMTTVKSYLGENERPPADYGDCECTEPSDVSEYDVPMSEQPSENDDEDEVKDEATVDCGKAPRPPVPFPQLAESNCEKPNSFRFFPKVPLISSERRTFIVGTGAQNPYLTYGVDACSPFECI
ncbi:unnamed protein product [Calicophoron daubneyi]|uniref:Notch n=1 Tax=Calicophoron daubneyi TaxID=300641 RepID=A0AAV2TF20_CALDB